MKSANAGNVIPASRASAGVGYQQSTQGISCRWGRDLALRYARSTALVRSAGMSAPSRVFSGAATPSHASQCECSHACTSIDAGSEITSSGACLSQARW